MSDVLALKLLAIDFLAMPDAEDQHDQAVVFDLRDEPVITHAVFPELPEAGISRRLSSRRCAAVEQAVLARLVLD
jgi:hypothetical protein